MATLDFEAQAKLLAIGGEAVKGGSYYDTAARLVDELAPNLRPQLTIIDGGRVVAAPRRKPSRQAVQRGIQKMRARLAGEKPAPVQRPKSAVLAKTSPLVLAGAGVLAWFLLK